MVIFVIYVYLDMNRISTKRYNLKGKDNLKIIQFSDLHKKTFGKGNIKLINIVKKENPDILVFTGDLVSRNQTDFTNIENLIQELCKLTKVYYILGNHEIDMPSKVYAPLNKKFQGYGAILLDNQKVKISEHTYLWGLTIPLQCYHDNNHSYDNLYYYTYLDIQSEIESPNLEDYNILLAHNPFFFESYSKWGADLSLCGHVHGGIIKLPFVNGLLSPERKFFPKYSGGLYSLDNKSMIVSRGLGKLRIFNPPEISVINIVAN